MTSRFVLPETHRFAVLMVVLAAVLAIVAAGGELSRHLAAIEARVAAMGPLGVASFVALYVLATSILIPESLFALAAGTVFGFWCGLAASMVGGVLAAVVQYGIGRRCLRDSVLRFAAHQPTWRNVQNAMARDEMRLQWLLRLAPFNPATISYLSGASGVTYGRFVLACCALTPHVALEVYAGYAASHFIRASHASAHTHGLHDALLIAGLAAVVAVFYRLSRIVRHAISDVGGADI